MGRMSKQKGAEFERYICKELSKWISSDKRDDLFWRSAMSGGRATLYNDKSKVKGQAGDITSIDREGQWLTDNVFIECKAYKKIGFDSFLYDNKGILAGFVKEVKKEALKYEKAFMLIFKENNRPIIVISNAVFPEEIELNSIHCYSGSINSEIIIFSLQTLFSVAYNKVEELLKEK